MPDLRPRLYFAPGLVRGAVSTGLHLDGLGHMQSDHWFLRLTADPDDDAVNLVQVYPSEALLREAKWAMLRDVLARPFLQRGSSSRMPCPAT